MVVIKITERKRKRCDWDGVPSSSVLDLTEDADEESAGEEDERREQEERGSPNLSSMKEEQENEGEDEEEEEEVLIPCSPSNESDDSNSPPLDSGKMIQTRVLHPAAVWVSLIAAQYVFHFYLNSYYSCRKRFHSTQFDIVCSYF